ncbi:hypothetical protein BC826DRAFT_1122765 [Russula brevipes]|nr:hypothetical protein BC826DRAFT_1122765 [Russula brevipes]
MTNGAWPGVSPTLALHPSGVRLDDMRGMRRHTPAVREAHVPADPRKYDTGDHLAIIDLRIDTLVRRRAASSDDSAATHVVKLTQLLMQPDYGQASPHLSAGPEPATYPYPYLRGTGFWRVRGRVPLPAPVIPPGKYPCGLGNPCQSLMVACLSSFKRLESFHLEIAGWPDRPSPPSQARTILPILTKFSFAGKDKYLEDFVARIDTPVLSQLYISMELVRLLRHHVFDIPRLRQFIGRTRGLEPSKAARVCFESNESWSIVLEFPPHGSTLQIERKDLPYLPSMDMVCNQLSPLISHVERLKILRRYLRYAPQGVDFMASILPRQLFRSFTAIQGLYVTKTLVPDIKSALRELIRDRESATGVLPNLCDLFWGERSVIICESDREVIQPFVDARQLSGQPVAIHPWREDRAYY